MATKAPQLVQRYITDGDRSLKDWHFLLRRATFGSAITLMLASVVSLHWACVLIGLPDRWYAPVAWIVPLAMEVGMAAVASTATTIRKDPKPGHEDKPGGYYLSLWVIFSFIMLLAQAANIGHAFSVIETRLAGAQIPPFVPDAAIYTFAAMFAALFPLGGTLLVHVSGFLRAHGTGARWIEDDAEVVYEQATPGAPAAQAPSRPVRTPRAPQRAPQAPAARTEPAQRAQEPAAVPAQDARPAATVSAQPIGDEQAAAREVFDRMVTANPMTKPDASRLRDEAGIEKHPATVRRWVSAWWVEHQESLGQGSPDPIEEQAAADEARAERDEAARTETSAA